MINLLTEIKSTSEGHIEQNQTKDLRMKSMVSTLDSNNDSIISIKDRLMVLEESLYSLRNISCIHDNLKGLDVCVQQILNKINLNQASISDLSKYYEW